VPKEVALREREDVLFHFLLWWEWCWCWRGVFEEVALEILEEGFVQER